MRTPRAVVILGYIVLVLGFVLLFLWDIVHQALHLL
jgi:hypothetical protein